ncbi:MAG: tetratricopeptide repeat protein [Syntrophobacteria bacterium]
MKRIVLMFIFVVLLVGASVSLTRVRDVQPPEARLGFFPPAPVIKVLAADQYQFLSQVISLQCVFYFGSLVESREQMPNWRNLYRALFTATRLDPYNMDTYYFAQAVLAWEAKMIPQVIELLKYGFEHRPWDFHLPYFISFDYAFFLKDYKRAGEYLAKAAELKPEVEWYATLAARYFYEGGTTALALAYLKEMIPTARNEAIRKRMITRARAFEKVLQIEQAIAAYKERFQTDPEDLGRLLEAGLLERIPDDPYGGDFYLDEQGRVRTTSKLVPVGKTHGSHKN